MEDYKWEPMQSTCEEYQCPCHGKLKIAIAALEDVQRYVKGESKALEEIVTEALREIKEQ